MRYLPGAHVDEVYAEPWIGRLLLSHCVRSYVKHVVPLDTRDLPSGACLPTQNTNPHLVSSLRATHPQIKGSLSEWLRRPGAACADHVLSPP